MKKSDVEKLYTWAIQQDFSFRRAPTAVGYSNQDIYFCWLKGHGKFWYGVRSSVVEDPEIFSILDSSEVLMATIACFTPGTVLGPHKDPPVYPKPYRRIQIPLLVHPTDCYMIWKNEKVTWVAGEPKIYDVMDHVHEGHNYSDEDMIFMFIDIEKRDDNSTLQEM
jgi:hypothetical protein